MKRRPVSAPVPLNARTCGRSPSPVPVRISPPGMPSTLPVATHRPLAGAAPTPSSDTSVASLVASGSGDRGLDPYHLRFTAVVTVVRTTISAVTVVPAATGPVVHTAELGPLTASPPALVLALSTTMAPGSSRMSA